MRQLPTTISQVGAQSRRLVGWMDGWMDGCTNWRSPLPVDANHGTECEREKAGEINRKFHLQRYEFARTLRATLQLDDCQWRPIATPTNVTSNWRPTGWPAP